MRKLFFAAIVLGAVSMLAACKKDKTGAGEGEGDKLPLIHTLYVTSPTDTATTTYEYDADGRLTKQIFSKPGYTDMITLYVYSAGQVEWLYLTGTDTIQATYFLNKAGMADSLRPKKLAYYYRYTYDANKYLIKSEFITSGSFSQTETYTIAAGNIVSKISDQPDYSLSYTYTDKVNTIGNENTGQAWLGKQSVNLPATSTDTYTGTSNYTYEYDSTGRVKSYVVAPVSKPSATATYQYTYY